MGIENEELWLAMKKTKYSNILSELSSSMDEKGELDMLLKSMLEAFCRAIHAEAGTLWYYDKKDFDYIYPKCAYGKTEIGDVKLKFGDGIVGSVIKDNKPVIIYDCSKDSRWNGNVDQKTGFKTESMICVPLCIEDSKYPFGAIQILNKNDGLLFDDTDLEYSIRLAKECVNILIQKVDAKTYDILSRKKISIRFDELINLTDIDDVKEKMFKNLKDNGYDLETSSQVVEEVIKIHTLLHK